MEPGERNQSAAPHADTYTVRTDVFEGPLDVLLNLIEKRKLLINDITLAEVTDEFIEFVNTHRTFPVSQASHFIYVAATLLLIKSKSLLPNLELTEEEQGDIADLEHRLAAYDYVTRVAKRLRREYGITPLYYRRRPPAEPVFAPDDAVSPHVLGAAAANIIDALPKHRTYEQVTVREVVSLEEVLTKLHKRVSREVNMSFREFAGGGSAVRGDVVVSFLALLELIKQGAVVAEQAKTFGDITIASHEVGVPDYE